MASQALVYDTRKVANTTSTPEGPPEWFANQEFKLRVHFFAYDPVSTNNDDQSITVVIPFGASAKKATDLVIQAVASQASIDLGVTVDPKDVMFCEFLSTIPTGND